MSEEARAVATLVDMLPGKEQALALEIIKRLVLAWDPDYTKQTEAEAEEWKEAHEAALHGETVSMEDINWA